MPLELLMVGGCEKIGRGNCLALRSVGDSKAVMYDCGGMQCFDMPIGCKPDKMDFSLVDPEELKAVYITHGHLDHIGGLADLAEHLGANGEKKKFPLLGTMFTQGCIRQEFEDNKFRSPLESRVHHIYDREGINGNKDMRGSFTTSTLHVDHTIPQAVGFLTLWQAPGGRNYRLLHLGDFRLGELWQSILTDPVGAGVYRPDVLFLDSSGADRPGKTPPEEDGVKEILHILKRHPGQNVILACFSTNVGRYREVIDRLEEPRNVEIRGYSMGQKMALASGMGLFRPLRRQSYPKNVPALIIMTGAQAESYSALWSYVYGNGQSVESFDPSVVIVLSARVIPGHEDAVRNLVRHARSQMNESGRVYASMNSPQDIGAHELLEVSPSGHCCADDLTEVIDTLKPRLVVPIHGDKAIRSALADIARSVKGTEAVLVEDGEVFELVS